MLKENVPLNKGILIKSILLIVLFILLLFLAFFIVKYIHSTLKDNYIVNSGLYFEVKNNSGPAPLTVAIQYDLSKVMGKNIFIDYGEIIYDKKPEKLSRNESIITHKYLQPYFYKIKVLRDNQLIGMNKALVSSKNWESRILSNSEYHFMHSTDSSSFLAINSTEIVNKGIDTQRIYFSDYRNIKDFNLSADSMEFSMQFMIMEKTFNRNCATLNVFLLGKNEEFKLYLSQKDCSNNSRVDFSDIQSDENQPNMSELFFNTNIFNELAIRTTHNRAQIIINKKIVYELTYNFAAGQLMGINIVASGDAKLKNIIVK